jgi:hypothetical protein
MLPTLFGNAFSQFGNLYWLGVYIHYLRLLG